MSAAKIDFKPSFYVTGGTLRRDAPSYVARRADKDLYDGLTQGKFCYVLTSRQMGKSSLMVRTASRLREEGVAVAVLDLTAMGQSLTSEQWYDGLLGRIGRQLKLANELEEFWLEHDRLGPLQRWMRAIEEVVLPHTPGQVVIFVDEIDTVRSLPFSTDEFFAGIREFYNRRTEEPELERLTFCLLGVATPSDLIRDTRMTPFNIGHRIELNDFTEIEAAPLARGLGREEELGAKLLGRILYWTGGHPYLTQLLCQAVAEEISVSGFDGVDRLCEELFLSPSARERDHNLLFVRERMLRSEADIASLLELYGKVRKHKRVRDDDTNPLVSILRLSGIARAVDGYLCVRNRIYYRVFDWEWVKANMPDAELRRQRAAYRRGWLRAAALLTSAAVIFAILAVNANKQRIQAKLNADQAQIALAEADRQRRVAEEQKAVAEQQRTLAEKAADEAKLSAQRAEEARAEAERQRELAENRRAETEQQRKHIEELEMSTWGMIKDQPNTDFFRIFLDLYPKGKFVGQAKERSAASTQNTGALAGSVYDITTKTPMAGVTVMARNEELGLERSTLTGTDGTFLMTRLPEGYYTLAAKLQGYEDSTVDNFPIKVNQINNIRPPLFGLRKAK